MKFSFTDEQIEFRDAVRDLLAKECSPAKLREAWTNDTGRIAGLWAQLVEMGVIGMLAPESAGGLGMDEVDLVLILEETGRVALPEPIVETAAALAMGFGAPEHGVTIGGPVVGLAPWADTIGACALLADDDRVIQAVRRGAPRPSVDRSRRLFELDPGVEFGGHAPGTAARAFDHGALGTAAQLCGLADRMIEMTVEYVKERKQFGVPVGSQQAVKHHLANARLALEFARPLVYRAAYSVAHDDPARSDHVSMAKAQASDAASTAASVALQCHGAIGYTTEYDLHLYMKRAWALARAWGDAAWHRARVERTLFGGNDNG
jgi:alkylation response protein AidB-like acyl-CoA dehydrogenase